MSDDEKSETEESLPVRDEHRVLPVFVNQVVGRGHLNGVVNLTFATALFTPNETGIDPDLMITSRLRMDLACAQQLWMCLGKILDSPKNETVN